MTAIVVAALYRFVPLEDFADRRQPILDRMNHYQVHGTLLLAREGINGTIAGSRSGIDGLVGFLRQDPRLSELDVKESFCDQMPFKRARVRLKKEIVTMGVEQIDPRAAAGTYVDPEEWNDLIADPDVTVIDTRNDYEVAIGSFQGAIDPNTHTFREFPDYVRENLDPDRHPKIAMYCTGGIRCEKSTALLKQQGFQEVYHLRGGILKYLETIPENESLWDGECFVFDGRVAVGHELKESDHVMCFGCGWPVPQADQSHPDFVAGVHCRRCVGEITDEQRKRFSERQRQLDRDRTAAKQTAANRAAGNQTAGNRAAGNQNAGEP